MSDTDSSSSKNRTRLLIAIAVLVGGIILLVVTECASVDETPDEPPATTGALGTDNASSAVAASETVRAAPRAFGVAASSARPHPADGAEERSPLADRLNAPGQSVREDLAIVAELLASHLEEFRELPVGDNAEITAALSGDNLRRHAPLPVDHRAINAAGELVDRWSTPFFFHQLAADVMEIQSAGPDRRHHTDDDDIWPQRAEVATLAER